MPFRLSEPLATICAEAGLNVTPAAAYKVPIGQGGAAQTLSKSRI
jgi:hypothetical protein